MASINAAILAFNRGIVDKRGLSRVDLNRLAWSAEVQSNWVPRSLGSMMLRPGLEYIGSTDGNNQAKHLDFIFSTSDTAIIELTNQKMRVRVDEEIVTRASVSSAVSNGTFTSDLTGWTDGDESGATSDWKTGGYLSLIGTRYNAAIRTQEVTVSGGDQNVEHALDIVIERGPVTLRVGSTSGDDDYISETTLATGYHSLAFTPAGNFFVQFLGYRQAESLVDSVAVASAGDMELVTPWQTADLSKVRKQQSADVIFIACDGYQQRKIERRGTKSWSVVLYETADGPFRLINTSTLRLTPSALNGDITLTASRAFFESDHVGALFKLTSIGQSVEVDATGESQWSNSVRVTGVGSGRQISITRAGTWSATVTLQRSVGEEGDWTDVTTYTTNGTVAYNDGLDNQIVFYRIGIDTGDYTSGTAELSITYDSGGIDGVCRVTGYTNETTVSAAVLTDLGATSATENWYESVWSDNRGWPTTVQFYEGRLWWFGRNWIIGSVSDAFDSFDDTIEGDSAAIVRTIGSGPVDVINWAVGVERLLIGAQGSEIAVRSSSLDEPLTPTNFNLKNASTYGSGSIDAVTIDKEAIFVAGDGKSVFRLGQQNGVDYSSLPLTDLAPDIADEGFTQMSVQRRPDTRVHCLRTDGTAAMLLFYPEEDVRCWIDVETDGEIEDVVVLPGTDEDSVYYTVKRTVDGNTVRYFEKWALEKDASSFTTTYNGTSTTTITDLDYDEGTVVTVRDENAAKIENLTVSDGSITLSTAATYCRITPSVLKLGDSFLIYSGTATATITGLSHLEGKSVVVFADGMALRDADGDIAEFTVASGQIALTDLGVSVSVEEACIGIGYRARFKGTKMAYAAQLGTALTQLKRITTITPVAVNLHNQGVRYGPTFDNLDDMPAIVEGEAIGPDVIYPDYDVQSVPFPGKTGTDERFCMEARAPRPAVMTAAVAGMKTDEKDP
jgi:hypothetical protein